jgi:transcriptional regulator with XRE-family HTH domain
MIGCLPYFDREFVSGSLAASEPLRHPGSAGQPLVVYNKQPEPGQPFFLEFISRSVDNYSRMKELKVKFSDKLRALRLNRQISLTELARRSGVNKGYLSSLETGRQSNPSRYKLEAICKVLDVELNYFSEDYDPVRANQKLKMGRGLRNYIEQCRKKGDALEEEVIRDLSRIQFRGVHDFSSKDYALLHSQLEIFHKERKKKS